MDFFLLLPNEIVLNIMDYLSLPDLAAKLWSLGSRRIRLLCLEFCKRVYIRKEWDMRTARKVILMASATLEHLTLSSRENMHNTDFNNSLAIMALERSPNMTVISCHQNVLSEMAMLAVKQSNSMRVMQLGDCHKRHICGGCCLSFDSLIPYTASLSKLTGLYMSWVPVADCDSFIKVIIENCKQLNTIWLPLSLKLTDGMFNYLLDGVQNRLVILSVNGATLTDASFCNLSKCRHLKHLLVHNALKISVENIAKLSFQLQRLYLARRSSLAAEDFVKVLNGKSRETLTWLQLLCCENFDDISLRAFAMVCPNLEQLSLFGCSNVSDRGVIEILEKCKKVKILDVRGTRVTGKAFTVHNSINLKEVYVEKNLKNVLREVMPRCKLL